MRIVSKANIFDVDTTSSDSAYFLFYTLFTKLKFSLSWTSFFIVNNLQSDGLVTKRFNVMVRSQLIQLFLFLNSKSEKKIQSQNIIFLFLNFFFEFLFYNWKIIFLYEPTPSESQDIGKAVVYSLVPVMSASMCLLLVFSLRSVSPSLTTRYDWQ